MQPHKFRQFEIPAVNVNRQNVNQIVNDYIKNIPKYDFTNFYDLGRLPFHGAEAYSKQVGLPSGRPDE